MTDEPEIVKVPHIPTMWGMDENGVFIEIVCPECGSHSRVQTNKISKFTEERMKDKSKWGSGEYKIMSPELNYVTLEGGKIRILEGDAGSKEIRLEAGSGFHPTKGYIHMDMDEDSPHVEVWGNIKEMPFVDENFDEFRAIHVIEHIWWADLLWTFSEINRVLKMGGEVSLEVPDFDVAIKRPIHEIYHFNMALYAEFKTEHDLCYYANAPLYLMHHSTFNYEMLKWYLEQTGFGEIMRDKGREKISQHGWLGVLAIKARKISNPKPSKAIFSDYWLGVNSDYPYYYKYVKKWG